MMKYITIYMLCAILTIGAIKAQKKPQSLSDFNPSPTQPFGKLNPDAPPETKQFAFMVGEFDRIDSLLDRKTGQWSVSRGEWNASYFMNGFGIQDQSWNIEGQTTTSNIRIFDAEKGKWIVTWFKMPTYGSTVAEGGKEGDNIVIKSTFNGANGPVNLEYVFYEITENSYKWVGQARVNGQAFPFWKISCKRKS